MLLSLAANLGSRQSLAKLFQSAKIDLSFFGFGLEVSGSVPIVDIEVALDRMSPVFMPTGRGFSYAWTRWRAHRA